MLGKIREYILSLGEFDSSKVPAFQIYQRDVSEAIFGGAVFGKIYLVPQDELAKEMLDLYKLGCYAPKLNDLSRANDKCRECKSFTLSTYNTDIWYL